MPEVKPAKPVKPIPAERLQPNAVWHLQKFSEQQAQAEEALTAQVLERMRAELQPQLDEQVAQLKASAEQEGYQQGYQIGYEKGYAEAKAAAETEVAAQLQQALSEQKAVVERLVNALSHPLLAWEETLVHAMAQLLAEALQVLAVQDPEAKAAFFTQQLQQTLPHFRDKAVPIDIYLHPDNREVIAALLPVKGVQLHEDSDCTPDQIRIEQGHSLVQLDWPEMLRMFAEQLKQQMISTCDQTSTPTDTTTASAAS